MKVLKVSSAGVRGIVGAGMSAEVAMAFAQAFATYLEGGIIVLARDSRPSGVMMRSAVLSGLLASGCRVIDLGVCPSPSVRNLMGLLKADGGIIIAAGHNPQPWNALKFLASDGSYLTALQGQELLEIYHHAEFRSAGWEEIQPLERDDSAATRHIETLKSRFDCQAIARRKFKVAIDCCNGTCSTLTPRLLEEIGCEVVVLNDDIRRPFPRYPNPTPDNMNQLESLSKAARADIGFAHDAEGERLGLVTEEGKALHQEYTFALSTAVKMAASEVRGPVVTSLSTSWMAEKIAEARGVAVHRVPIGPAHVTAKALQLKACVAGEGSGSVILPDLQRGPDGIAAIMLILEHLAKTGQSLTELVGTVPRFHMIKENISLPTNLLYRKLQRFRTEAERQYPNLELNLLDGVRLTGTDGWIHVRASSTESILRVITEAVTQEVAQELHSFAQGQILE